MQQEPLGTPVTLGVGERDHPRQDSAPTPRRLRLPLLFRSSPLPTTPSKSTFRCPLPAHLAFTAPPVSYAAGYSVTPQQQHSEEFRRAGKKRLPPGGLLFLPGWRGSSAGAAASGLPGGQGASDGGCGGSSAPHRAPSLPSSSSRLRPPRRTAALGGEQAAGGCGREGWAATSASVREVKGDGQGRGGGNRKLSKFLTKGQGKRSLECPPRLLDLHLFSA